MRAITVRDREADAYRLSVTELPYPHAAENDVIVQVHSAGFTAPELVQPGERELPVVARSRRGR